MEQIILWIGAGLMILFAGIGYFTVLRKLLSIQKSLNPIVEIDKKLRADIMKELSQGKKPRKPPRSNQSWIDAHKRRVQKELKAIKPTPTDEVYKDVGLEKKPTENKEEIIIEGTDTVPNTEISEKGK